MQNVGAPVEQPELGLQESRTPHSILKTLGVPCGFVDSNGKGCRRLGHVGGQIQYDSDRVLVY
jgi:hypothetical protein